jgi:hypothetical protein
MTNLEFSYNYKLNILSDNRFVLISNVWSNDLYFSNIISQGKYIQNKNDIICIDDVYDYKFTFKKKDNEITAKIILSGLKEFVFTKSNDYEESTYFESNRKKISEVKKENRNKFKYHTLYYGLYGGKLKLIKPDIYEYYHNGNLLSKGTFKRDGVTNELELFDTELQEVWKLFFIEDMRLIDSQRGVLFFETVSEKEIEKYANEHLK